MRPRDPTDPGCTPPNFSNEHAFLSRSFLTFHPEAKNLNKINNNRDLFHLYNQIQLRNPHETLLATWQGLKYDLFFIISNLKVFFLRLT